MTDQRVTRRRLLVSAGLFALAAPVLAACGASAPPTNTPRRPAARPSTCR